jgi:NADPH-dependent curcumin reductase CurA
MRALATGEVVESRHPRFPTGALVQGTFGVQEYAVTDGRDVTILDPALGTPSMYLGVLGSTGLTAYYGLLEHGRPRAGDTVVVSAAAGGVGSIVGQLARISGSRVVGIAGGPDKCRYLTETLGFDAAIDYRETGLRRRLAEACPTGVDVYFDNVGGQILETALSLLAMHARVVVCGAISQYNATERPKGPANYMSLLIRRATMGGFLYFDHAADFPVARQRLGAWVADGAIVAPETIAQGTVRDFPATLRRLFSGDNLGKLVLDITDRSAT